MIRMKSFLSLIIAVSILLIQVGGVSAAPALESSVIGGTVQRITLETDPSTGITTVIVDVVKSVGKVHTVRISEKTATDLGLVLLDGDGKPVINEQILGKYVEITQEAVIPAQQDDPHPVGNALATYFSEIADYKTIMDAHADGVGFGVIAQALWLTQNMEGGDSEVFQSLILAKQTGIYEGFTFQDGTTVKNWGQLQKAILDGKKLGNPGTVMQNKENNGTANNQGNNKDKDKKDNNGRGNDNENGNEKEKNK